ncbi:MAG: hypothetical protein JNM90_23665 [Burkholderiales bacterium]|nr:hypothetical protein [Burkholderiales bacterium]
MAIITDPFRRSAQMVAQLNGLPEYPFALVGHPIANDDDAALQAKAEIALAQILPLLLERKA